MRTSGWSLVLPRQPLRLYSEGTSLVSLIGAQVTMVSNRYRPMLKV
jgi:hypothetical protein